MICRVCHQCIDQHLMFIHDVAVHLPMCSKGVPRDYLAYQDLQQAHYANTTAAKHALATVDQFSLTFPIAL